VLLVDDESRSYWDHLTGEALHGSLAGVRMEAWPLRYTTVAAALEADPGLTVSRPRPPTLVARLMRLLHRRSIGRRGFLPPGFRRTMGKVDPRLPEMTQGLGVIDGERTRFFAGSDLREGVREDWGGRCLRVSLGALDRVPFAEWEDGGRPMQIFCRWYGFSFSFPGCEVYRPGGN